MSQRPLHLVFVTVDFLRADHLSCHGHPRTNTWYLDRLAREGVRFARCHAASPHTLPARVSLLSSLRPAEHQVLGPSATPPPGLPSLFGELAAAGFENACFGKPEGIHADDLERCFVESQVMSPTPADDPPEFTRAHAAFSLDVEHPYNRAAAWTEAALGFLDARPDRAAAVWLSFLEPGPPYACPPPYDYLFATEEQVQPPGWPRPDVRREPARNEVWRVESGIRDCPEEELRRLLSIYQGQVRLVDDQVGKLLRHLGEKGRLDQTLVVLVGTHGDLLGQRGLLQNPAVFYQPLVHVPWILRHPGGLGSGKVVDGLVETIDVVPTVLECLGLPVPPTMVGRSWLRGLASGKDVGRDYVIVQGGLGGATRREPRPGEPARRPLPDHLRGPGCCVVGGGWKLCVYADDQGELFDLEDDPQELRNRHEDPSVIDVREELMRALVRELLATKVREVRGPWPSTLGPDLREAPPAAALPAPGVPAGASPSQRGGPRSRLEVTRRRVVPTPPKRAKVTSAVKVTRVPWAKAAGSRSVRQILFVCTGNYYRSRFAEAFFNYFANVLNLRWSASSRGLDIGRVEGDLSPITRGALEERDIPLDHTAAHRQALDAEDLNRADRIIVLSESEHRPMLAERFPDWVDRVEYWEIPDLPAPPAKTLGKLEEQVTALLRGLDA